MIWTYMRDWGVNKYISCPWILIKIGPYLHHLKSFYCSILPLATKIIKELHPQYYSSWHRVNITIRYRMFPHDSTSTFGQWEKLCIHYLPCLISTLRSQLSTSSLLFLRKVIKSEKGRWPKEWIHIISSLDINTIRGKYRLLQCLQKKRLIRTKRTVPIVLSPFFSWNFWDYILSFGFLILE